MAERYYSSVAVETELTSSIDEADLSISVDSTTGFPSEFPYTLVIDKGTVNEEAVEVTDASGSTLTVSRGIDGTVAQSHDSGADVVHGFTARDLQDSRDHEESDDAHGVSGTIVGTQGEQTLEDKTLDGDDNTFQNIPQSAVTGLEDALSDIDDELVEASPSGIIVMWSGSVANVPTGWALCDGSNGTPDLRDRFIVGAGDSYNPDDTGGSDAVALSEGDIPSHRHGDGSYATTHTDLGSHNHGSGSYNTTHDGTHEHELEITEHTSTGGKSHDHAGSASRLARSMSTGAHPVNTFESIHFSRTNGNHEHDMQGFSSSRDLGSHNHGVTGESGTGIDLGGSSPEHENRPPYYALAFIMRL